MSRTQTWLPTVSLSLRRTDCASSHSPSLRTERHNPHLNDRPILPPRHTHTPHTPSWQKGPPHTPSALLLPTLRTTPSMSTPIRDPPPRACREKRRHLFGASSITRSVCGAAPLVLWRLAQLGWSKARSFGERAWSSVLVVGGPKINAIRFDLYSMRKRHGGPASSERLAFERDQEEGTSTYCME